MSFGETQSPQRQHCLNGLRSPTFLQSNSSKSPLKCCRYRPRADTSPSQRYIRSGAHVWTPLYRTKKRQFRSRLYSLDRGDVFKLYFHWQSALHHVGQIKLGGKTLVALRKIFRAPRAHPMQFSKLLPPRPKNIWEIFRQAQSKPRNSVGIPSAWPEQHSSLDEIWSLA